MKIKSKIGYCTIVILIMLMITNNAYAITRYATGVGTNAFQMT